MWNAVIAISIIMVVLAGLTLALSALNKATFSITKEGLKTGINTTVFVIAALGTALLGLAAAVWILSKADWDNAGYVLLTVGGFLLLLFTTIVLLNKFPQHASGKQILATALIISSITASILVLAASIALLALIPADNLKRGLDAIKTLLIIMGVIVVAITAIALITNIFTKQLAPSVTVAGKKNKTVSKNITKIAGMFFDIGIAMLLLAASIAILGSMDSDKLNRGVIVVGAFLVAIGVLTAIVAGLSVPSQTNMAKVGGMFAGLGLMILSITLFLAVASLIRWERALAALGSLALVIGAIVGLMYVVGKFTEGENSKAFTKGAGLIMGIGVALLSIAAAMLILSLMSVEGVAKSLVILTAIGIFLVILSGLIGLIGKWSDGNAFAKGAGVFIGIGVAIFAIAAALLIISMIPVESLMTSAVVLGVLMLVFGAMNLMSMGVKDTGKSMMYIAIVIGVLAAALAVLSMLDMGRVYAAVVALSAVMLVLGAVIKDTNMAGTNLNWLWQMAIVIAALGGVIALLCLFSPGELFAAVGAMAAMVVVVEAVVMLLERLSGKTITFNFGNIIKTLVKIVLITVVLGALVLALSLIPNPWNAVAATLAMVALAGSILVMGIALSGLSKIPVQGILIGLGYVLLIAVALSLVIVILSGGIWAGLQILGDGLSRFWNSIEPFMEGIKTLSPESTQGIKNLAEACLALAGASAITTLTSIFGGTNFGELGIQLQEFGKAMVDFSTTVAGKINEDAIEAASNAGSLLIDMAAKLPKTGGVVQWFTGEAGDLATFGTQLVSFGKAMVMFSSVVAGNINETAITAAANAGSVMVELQNKLPKTGGLVQSIVGWQNLDLFSTNLVSFGHAIVEFSNTVAGNINETAVIAAANAGSVIAELQNKLPETSWFKRVFTGENDLTNFSKNLPKLGTAIVDFSNNLDGLNVKNVTAATGAIAEVTKLGEISSSDLGNTVTQVDKLIDICNGMGLVNVTGMSSFGTALKTVADNGIKAFIQTFNDSVDEATAAVDTLIMTMISNIDAGYAGFATSGAYVGAGFVAGVESKWQAAYDAGYSIGLAAKQGTKDATDQNSPSKVFYELGGFCGVGFVNAFVDYESKSFAAGSDLANSAVNGLSKALSHVQDVVDSDMDVQPTVRPVLDLSDIKSGVGQMNGLLNSNPSVGVEANLSAIKRLQNNQNGVNLSDVVSAIDKLSDKETPSGDIYNINGITYDDGSNIAEAIATIVRAAIVERRT